MSQLSNGEMNARNTLHQGKPVGPVSKRKAKRILEKQLTQKAADVDDLIRSTIKTGAEELGVPSIQLMQRFAIVAPVGEQRKPTYWNGLFSSKAEEWRDEYSELSIISST
jgi:hypothetical protein